MIPEEDVMNLREEYLALRERALAIPKKAEAERRQLTDQVSHQPTRRAGGRGSAGGLGTEW